MSDSKNLPKELPDMEYSFSIDVEGNTTRQKFTGDFKFLIPNNKKKAQADRYRAELNGGLDDRLDPEVLVLNYTIAYLRFSLTEVPKWWKEKDFGYELHDFNVVNEVYKKCQEFEKNWLKEVWGEEVVDESGEKGDEGKAE